MAGLLTHDNDGRVGAETTKRSDRASYEQEEETFAVPQPPRASRTGRLRQ